MGEALADVLEGDGFEAKDDVAEAGGEELERGEGGVGVGAEEAEDGFCLEEEDGGLFFCHRGGGVDTAIEDGDLGEGGAGGFDVDGLLAAVLAFAEGADGAGDDDVEAVGGVAAGEEDFAAGEVAFAGGVGEWFEVRGWDGAEDCGVREGVDAVGSGHEFIVTQHGHLRCGRRASRQGMQRTRFAAMHQRVSFEVAKRRPNLSSASGKTHG